MTKRSSPPNMGDGLRNCASRSLAMWNDLPIPISDEGEAHPRRDPGCA
ncbi:MAG: hypothetical protein JHC92_09665 [Sphingomonadaceae bacterium]|nr:hypothetical protein [Sphingomonadaceae bacterium]